MPLAIAALDRHERRRRAVVEHVGVGHAEAALEKRREPARHAQIGFDAPRVAALEPPRQPDGRMPVAQPEAQQRVPEIVPVDEEPHAPAAQRPPRDRERREGRRVLHEDQIGARQPPQRPPQAEAQAHRIEQAGDRVTRSVQAAADPQPRALQPMDGNARIVGNALGQRRPFEADEIDVDAVRHQRVRVVLHAGASPQISERNNGGSHSGNGLEGWREYFKPFSGAGAGTAHDAARGRVLERACRCRKMVSKREVPCCSSASSLP